MTAIDHHLNSYATDFFGAKYEWWWNGNDVLATAIASLVHHLVADGHAEYTDAEYDQLGKLARYFKSFDVSSGEEGRWLHAEAMWLLGRWFHRLWD